WYHPHPLHKTGEQVYKGLAGLLLIEDEVSQSLPIPDDYGVNDFPLIIQDRNLNEDGQLSYNLNMMSMMHGMEGDTPLVNGAYDADLEVPRGKVRLRLLNGSNARVSQFQLEDGAEFWQIASDGGFLEKPVKMDHLVLGPSERAEDIVDFSLYERGKRIEIQDQDVRLMNFIVGDEPTESTECPEQLTRVNHIEPTEVSTVREFVIQGMGPHVKIKGKQIDMDRIDEEIDWNESKI